MDIHVPFTCEPAELHDPATLRVGLLVEARYRRQAQPAGVKAALEAWGHQVHLLDPGETASQVGAEPWTHALDVVVARGRSSELLALLGWAECLGVPMINRRAAIASVLDKGEMSVALARAGLPTPTALVAPIDTLAHELPAEEYPLVIKPVFGDNSRGLNLVRTHAELRVLAWAEPIALAQHYVPSDGYDLKLYGIGEQVFAVRKTSPLSSGGPLTPGKPELVPTTPEQEKLAHACMELFDLELYGVDCIETPDGPVVIEVNDFPNYSAIPGCDELLADHIVSRTRAWSSR